MAEESRRFELANIIKKAPSRQVDNVFIGLTYVIAVLLLVFAIIPTISAIFQVDKEIKEKEVTKQALENKLSALSALDIEYNDKASEFKDLSLLFPSTGNFSLFLSNIDAVIARNNFVLNSISFSEYDRDTYNISTLSLKPWSVRMAVSGKKVYLITLLRDLEAMPMYPVIESLSYSEDVDENGNTRYSLALRIYHIPDNPKFYN